MIVIFVPKLLSVRQTILLLPIENKSTNNKTRADLDTDAFVAVDTDGHPQHSRTIRRAVNFANVTK